MNLVLESIKKRRSVRSYESKPVPKDIINAIIEAGNQAPSAMNSQPWRFVVVENSSFKQKILNTAMPNAKKILEHVKENNPERYEAIMKNTIVPTALRNTLKIPSGTFFKFSFASTVDIA